MPDRQTVQSQELAVQGLAARQVANRLKVLLPSRLAALVEEYRGRGFAAGKARRLALIDKRYRGYLRELLGLRHEALRGKITLELTLMRHDLRRSMNAHRLQSK